VNHGTQFSDHPRPSRPRRPQRQPRTSQYVPTKSKKKKTSDHINQKKSNTTSPAVLDAVLTPLGVKQATSLIEALPQLQQEIDLIVTSPLRRTLQTTTHAFTPAIARLGYSSILCIPQAQECGPENCNIGSPRSTLESTPEFSPYDLSRLTPDWTSKSGFYATDPASLARRATWVRRFLRDQPPGNKTIVLVAHGDFLRYLTASASDGAPAVHPWRNAEVKAFRFDPESVEGDDGECWLVQEGRESLAPGYPWRATEADLIPAGGKL
jgi:broad specificity phosphatase PhoE